MKITVLGASGRSGQEFVNLALSKGHIIRAVIHHSNPFTISENLEIVRSDLMSESEMSKLIEGTDAIVSLLGHSKSSPKMFQTEIFKKLIPLLNQNGPRRLLLLTGDGVRTKGDRISLIDRLMNMSIKLVDPWRIKDGIEHVRLLEKSGLNWTVLRVLKLRNSRQRTYSLSDHGPAKLLVSRKEVAIALLELLEKDLFVQKMPVISRPKKNNRI